MKIYHTETQEDYDALMVELEKEGYLWCSGKLPTSRVSRWIKHMENFCVIVGDAMSYSSKS